VLLAVVMALGVASSAYATTVTSWTNYGPQGTVVGGSVIANGTGVYDGFALSAATSKLYVDGVLIPKASYTVTVTSGRTVYFRYTPNPKLIDGPHTFRVEISDTRGALSQFSWGCTVAAPPAAGWLAPQAGAVLNHGRPAIQMILTDNTPTTTITLTGQVRGGSATGPVQATFGGSYPLGIVNFTLASELPPGTHYLTATITDSAGKTATVVPMSFVTVAAPAMTVVPADCTGCHPVTVHPSDSGCASCHAEDDHGSGLICSATGCHPQYHQTTYTPCAQCHTAPPTGIPAQHTPESSEPGHMSSCNGCHVESLIARHAFTAVGSVYPYQCDLCHESADPVVSAAILAGDTTCDACHDVGPDHGYSAAQHTADIDGDGLAGTWPYVDPAAAVQGRLMNTPYVYSDVICLDCHTAEIAGASGEHSKASASTAGAGCAACHPSPRNTFADWDGTCYACHAQAGVHAAADLSALHTLADSNPSDTGSCAFVSPTNGRRPCHYPDIVQEHNRLINPDVYSSDLALSVTCEECHTNAATIAALADGWDGTCDDCHDGTALPNHSIAGTTRYDEAYAIHDNPSGFYDNGDGYSGYNAMDAHGPIRPGTGGANQTIGCGAPTCHTQAYIGGGWPFSAGPACAECHGPNVVSAGVYQGEYAWYSDFWYDGEALDTRLTMTLDPITLPAGSTLDFMTAYDIEEDWDYGYVQISTDGGATWTNLSGALTTLTNPFGQNLGNGITGSTGGAWVPASFDLSAYAGMTVQLRFDYVADFYVYGNGWMMDVISVGPAGSPVFYDDVETVRPEWEVETYVTYYDYEAEIIEPITVPTTATGWHRYNP
jgi:hypothetical protein